MGKITLIIIIALVLMGNNVYSMGQKPGMKEGACFSSTCHSETGNDKFVHGPVFEGKCEVCHEGRVKQNKRTDDNNCVAVKKKLSRTCISCHENIEFKEFVHWPLMYGECTSCHNPHGSEYKFQLVSEGSDLCFQCHDKQINMSKYQHGPSAMGGCVLCHDPHSSDYRNNLKAEGTELCFMCHSDKGDQYEKAEYRHEPVAEKCTNCHDPHSAPSKFMLSKDVPEACYSCHKDKKGVIEGAPVQHAAVTEGKKCLNCHSPHMSDVAQLLKKPTLDICISCHDKQLKTPEGIKLINMKQLLSTNIDHHGPIRQKDCSGCHDPHGSQNFRILHNSYPSTFYAPFEIENYTLCFNCHEKRMVLDEETSTLTNFRNGNTNLHFKHVNKKIKGRTCRACHETHASNYPKHIREYVPYGKKDYLLTFTKTYSGGSCKSGCHSLKRYNRVTKMMN
jgi:predicted CXXCH cytochrome family protein